MPQVLADEHQDTGGMRQRRDTWPPGQFAQGHPADMNSNIIANLQDRIPAVPGSAHRTRRSGTPLRLGLAGTRLPAAALRRPPRHITPHALRRRFTVVERTALEWAVVDRAEAGEADRLNAATLRSLLKDIEQARQLDLDDPELADSLRQFEAFGLIAAGRAQEILDGPVQAHEQP